MRSENKKLYSLAVLAADDILNNKVPDCNECILSLAHIYVAAFKAINGRMVSREQFVEACGDLYDISENAYDVVEALSEKRKGVQLQ